MLPGWKKIEKKNIYIYIKQNNKFNKEFKNDPHQKTKIFLKERKK